MLGEKPSCKYAKETREYEISGMLEHTLLEMHYRITSKKGSLTTSSPVPCATNTGGGRR